MSIFYIGGPKGIIVPESDIKTTEERYFMPGIVHGCELVLLQVYGWNADGGAQNERIGARYISTEEILSCASQAVKNGSFDEETFYDILNEKTEEFVVENDGSGDFYTLNSVWDQAVVLDSKALISWATEVREAA